MKYSLYSFLILVFLMSCTNSQTTTKKQTKEKKEVAVIKTNMGTIELELLPKDAPKAVENFTKLANKGYYDGVTFHRVIDNFMIQGGDPTGTGRGGESIWGKPFKDEISPDLKFDKAGILAMANAGPNTNGSQFFITLASTPWLDGHYTIFGKVIKGMDVVQAIGKVKTSKQNDKPIKDVIMEKVKVEKK